MGWKVKPSQSVTCQFIATRVHGEQSVRCEFVHLFIRRPFSFGFSTRLPARSFLLTRLWTPSGNLGISVRAGTVFMGRFTLVANKKSTALCHCLAATKPKKDVIECFTPPRHIGKESLTKANDAINSLYSLRHARVRFPCEHKSFSIHWIGITC